MSRPGMNVPLFCIFGIEYPEISKSTVSNLTLQVVDPFWTFREFIDYVRHTCAEIVQNLDDDDADLQTYAATVTAEDIEVLELRVNTCRGVPKAHYYDLVLLYYDERRIGDHIVNDYGQSEHTVMQIYVQVRKDRSSSITLSSSTLSNVHYQPAVVSARVRAYVRLRLVQAWHAAFTKYKDCRIRHIMHPRSNRDNDFTHIGIVKPFRVDLKRLAVYSSDTSRGDICAVQVLAYDKLTQQNVWFDILINTHCTLRRCKERIVEALRQTLDWADAQIEEIPHLIARCYQNNEMEDFLLCDDTMTLSYILPTTSALDRDRRPSFSVLPLITVIAFVGRNGRRVSDSKGRCVFEEEEHGSQLLVAAMGVYLNNFVGTTAKLSVNKGTEIEEKKLIEKEKEQTKSASKIISPEQLKRTGQLMKKERRMSQRATTSRQSSRSSHASNRSGSTCKGCTIS